MLKLALVNTANFGYYKRHHQSFGDSKNFMRLHNSVILILTLIAFSSTTTAQNRKAVSASEVNGTFRDENGSQFKILALGGGKLKIAFDGNYPYKVNGEPTANTGIADGIAEIKGDVATFIPDYAKEQNNPCIITLKFVRAGSVAVNQEGTDSDCGFGSRVYATGKYRKTSRRKPNFKRGI